MLTYNLDLEERSTWIRTTPGDFELAQPFWCTEQGDFYAHEGFLHRAVREGQLRALLHL